MRRRGPGYSFGIAMEIDLIFKIAAVGIIVSILLNVVTGSVCGLVVLMLLAQKIAALFNLVKTLFQF